MNYLALIAEHVQRLTPAEQKEVLDFILFLEQRAGRPLPAVDEDARDMRLAETLEKLQAVRPFGEIADPVDWQSEIRQDRLPPGRED